MIQEMRKPGTPEQGMRTVMWSGTVRALSFADQLRATTLAGCSALSVTPYGYTQWLAQGLNSHDLLSRASDAGVRLFHLDPLIRWVTNWRPAGPAHTFPYDALSFTADDFFGFAEALGIESFTAWGAFPKGTLAFGEIVEAFAALCARASDHGLRCDLEFLPMYGIPTLEAAWAIVAAAGASNSGVAFDFWHYFRGTPDDDLLRSIPGNRITAVQIADAAARPPPGVPLGQDGQTSRRLPGQGDFRIAEVVRILHDTGGLNNVGLEIFSTQFDAMNADEIGSVCRQSLARCFARLDAVRPGHGLIPSCE
jgi:sugar phosphate isomerase/epimerase